MNRDFEASKPIYMQIAEQLYKKLVRKEIMPGDKLLSVREMAVQSGVNPNTIQRAYGEMERMGIVETRRGQGTFVIEDDQIIDTLRGQFQSEILQTFVQSMRELGYTKKDMLTGLEQYLHEEEVE